MTPKKTAADLIVDNFAAAGILIMEDPLAAIRPVTDALEASINEMKARAEAAEGKLDIIVRETNGEPDDELAIDYGGTGWETSEPVKVVRALRESLGLAHARADGLEANLRFLLARTPTVDGVFTFPDGDTWPAATGEPYDAVVERVRVLEAERVEVQNQSRVLTCAFCGDQYPPGTPDSNHEALRNHVDVCEKHPAAALRKRIGVLEESDRRLREIVERQRQELDAARRR